MKIPITLLSAFILMAVMQAHSSAGERGAASAPPGEAASVQPAGEAPEKAFVEPYVYEGFKRRDPFFSLVTAAKQEEKKKKRFTSPLEEYDVQQMNLIAVVKEGENRFALIKLPNGKFYTLREGAGIGIHGGRITGITLTSMTVEEVTTDLRGGVYPKKIILKLREEEE